LPVVFVPAVLVPGVVGPPRQHPADPLLREPVAEPVVEVLDLGEVDIDIVSAVPPWENGALLPEARRVLEEQDEGALMGGPRFEQLSRATGTLRIGESVHTIDCGALRIRRRGIRRLGTFRGHAWQSAMFPSGKGFGYIIYPPRRDVRATYNEGYLFDGDGEPEPAWVVDAPWLRKLEPTGEDVSVVLETRNGTTLIEGRSVASCFMVMGGVGPGSEGSSAAAGHRSLPLRRRDSQRHDGALDAVGPGAPLMVGARDRGDVRAA
jgi:hypothetical protein